jgi:hypothetical protein
MSKNDPVSPIVALLHKRIGQTDQRGRRPVCETPTIRPPMSSEMWVGESGSFPVWGQAPTWQ